MIKTHAFQPAFPFLETSYGSMKEGDYMVPGLSKRELFAMNANVPWNAVLETMELKYGKKDFTIDLFLQFRSQLMVKAADALIKALNDVQHDKANQGSDH